MHDSNKVNNLPFMQSSSYFYQILTWGNRVKINQLNQGVPSLASKDQLNEKDTISNSPQSLSKVHKQKASSINWQTRSRRKASIESLKHVENFYMDLESIHSQVGNMHIHRNSTHNLLTKNYSRNKFLRLSKHLNYIRALNKCLFFLFHFETRITQLK